MRERLINEILALSFRDNAKTRFLQPDGTYRRPRVTRRETLHRSQFEFVERSVAGPSETGKAVDGLGKHPRIKLATSPFKSATVNRT